MRFSERNTRIFLFLSGFILFFIIGFLSPQWERVKSLRRVLAKEKNNLEEVKTLSRLIQKGAHGKSRAGSLFSLIEDIAKKSGLSGKIESIKPLPGKEKEGVEVRVSSLRTRELVKFLYFLEKTYRLTISKAKIEKNKDGKTFNLQLSLH
ncbi:MAG: type II secretion system protein M [Caldiserica bacterium]|nr:type II secretion system protein M [Caldisericota bacterium]